jgi:hypothetical protein
MPLDLGMAASNRVDLYDVPEATRSSYGQPSQASTLIASNLAAEIEQLSGNELVSIRQTRQILATATHRVKLHYLGPSVVIKPRMKFVANTRIGVRVLNVLSVDNTWEATNDWICICEERIGATS